MPSDIAVATYACLVESWQRSHGWIIELVDAVPRIASARPEELLPRAWAQPFDAGYSCEPALELVDKITDALGTGKIQTVRVSRTAGRNDPCGSGAKYKGCCGAPA